ncbi:hypothetical protein [Aureliella helgolandensis]|uniref:Uncharacterized protein n=1 Tax=Aureliella helgolandensis TaxID=2527968 RepID=A0A518G1T1_9BACT|nr:hypothetical protein [Aureliella helgolandensis]QDV22547.1 hypothetical protein Q31a_08330 [Aureliella helgolandensis]
MVTFDGNDIIATNQVDPQDLGQRTDPAKEALVTLVTQSTATGLPAISESSFVVNWCEGDSNGSGIRSLDIFLTVDKAAAIRISQQAR